MKKLIEVVAGIIKVENKYLAVQRKKSKYPYISYMWEFPGGKVENGESLEGALKREIKEELNLVVNNAVFFKTIRYSYPDFNLKMNCFFCDIDFIEKLILLEHLKILWLEKKELNSIEWLEADKKIVNYLLRNTGF